MSNRSSLLVVSIAAICGCQRAPLDGAAPSPGRYATDGQFAFVLAATDLDAWNGRTAYVVAYDSPAADAAQPVDANAVVSDGLVSFDCPSALVEDTNYPSIALYVDVNRSGACDEGDVGQVLQLFGWLDGHSSWTMDAGDDGHSWQPIDQLHGRTTAAPGHFCSEYF